jgi:transmembrane sensor
MTSSSTQSREAIAAEAAEWFVQNRGQPLDAGASASFVEWLKTSPVHIEEYLGIAAVARDLPVATDDSQLDLESLLASISSGSDKIIPLDRSQRRSGSEPALLRARIWHGAVAAAAVLIVGAALIWSMRDGERFGLPSTYRTAHGEQRVRVLPDGSVLHLNTDSEVTVRYSGSERVVELNSGQALFEVAHDGHRRFRVTAGPAVVIAVGTLFDVYRKSSTATVTVVEGTVAVYAVHAPPKRAALIPVYSVRLEAGHQLEVSTGISAPRRVDARAVTAWVARQIAFEDEALGEVAAEFNRYGSIALEIDDAALRALPISGVFDAYDVDSFAAFLETLNGVVIERTPTRIQVLNAASINRNGRSIPR